MTEQGKTRVWRLDDMLPAKEPERAPQSSLAQTIVGNFGVRDDGSAQRRIEAQRVVVIQPNTLTTRFEREEPARSTPEAQPTRPRARHTAEAWAAGVNIGAKTELRRNDAEVMQAIADAQARRAQEQASSIVIPRLPVAAKVALLKERLSKQPKERLFIASATILALGLLPLLSRSPDEVTQNLVAPAPLRAAANEAPLAAAVQLARANDAAGSVPLPAAAQREQLAPLTAAGNITPRIAIDALISGDQALAATRYEALARAHPERPELAAAARILRESAERAALSGE